MRYMAGPVVQKELCGVNKRGNRSQMTQYGWTGRLGINQRPIGTKVVPKVTKLTIDSRGF